MITHLHFQRLQSSSISLNALKSIASTCCSSRMSSLPTTKLFQCVNCGCSVLLSWLFRRIDVTGLTHHALSTTLFRGCMHAWCQTTFKLLKARQKLYWQSMSVLPKLCNVHVVAYMHPCLHSTVCNRAVKCTACDTLVYLWVASHLFETMVCMAHSFGLHHSREPLARLHAH